MRTFVTRYTVVSAIVLVAAVTACKKTGDNEYEVQRPVAGTVSETVHTPSVDMHMDSTTITVPKIKVEKDTMTVKTPDVDVKKN